MNRVRLAHLVAVFVSMAVVGGTVRDGRGETPQPQRYEFTQPRMGVPFTLTFYADDEHTATNAAAAAFERIEQLNAILSDYDPDSELNRLAAGSPHDQPQPVSPELWTVLHAAQQLSRQSQGAFDVTVGPLTRLWRRSRRQGELPPPERLTPALAAVDFEQLQLDVEQKSVRLARADMRLDLGGIAKGYAADEALAVLARHGIARALVDGSGDVALGDPPPGKRAWRVGVAPLRPDGPPSLHLRLANRAVATSGDAWQHVVIDGVRYSHIVDPKTGLGLTHQGAVTVVAPTAMLADAFASAVSVLGAARGIALAEQAPDVEAMFVYLDRDGAIQQRQTNGFAALAEPPAE